MKKFPGILFLVALVFAATCGPSPRGRIAARLDDVESYIDAHPDSALAVLRALDADSLRGPSQYARAALLHQVALDKCYIDITSDSILSPAFWYLKHGDADQKLRTWYYRSVLARNAGDIDTQMSCLIRAEQYIPKAEDPLMAGFVYTAKRGVYIELYDLENALHQAEKAAESFRLSGAESRYCNALLGLLNIKNMLNQTEGFAETDAQLQSRWGMLSEIQRGKLGAIRLSYASRTETPELLREKIHSYLRSVPEARRDEITLADAYLVAGQVDSAAYSLQRVGLSDAERAKDLSYQLVLSRLLEKQGDMNGSLQVFQQYKRLSDNKLQESAERVVSLGQESAGRRIQHLSHRILTLVSLLVLLILLIIFGVNIMSKQKNGLANESERRRREYDEVLAKKARLEMLLRHNYQEIEYVPLLQERLEILNQYSLTYLHGNREECKTLSQSLMNQMDNTRQVFQSIYPTFSVGHRGFMVYLQESGLTEREKECCCLLYLGLTRKELAFYLGVKPQTCYNLVTSARKKLGILDEKTVFSEFLEQKVREKS